MLALSTGSLYTYGLERVFALASATGFEGVEVLVDDRWDTRQPDFLRSLEKRYGLPIVSLHNPFTWRVNGWESGQLARLRRTADLAQALGVKVVVAHLPFRWHIAWVSTTLRDRAFYFPLPWPCRDAYTSWLMKELVRYEAETGLVVAIENMPCKRWGFWRLNPYRFNELSEMTRFPHVTMDTTHLGTWGIDILAAYEQLKGRLAHLHLSNYNGQEHRLPWDGELPLATLLERLRRDRYEGHLVVELAPESLGAGEGGQLVQRTLAEVVAFCRRYFA